NCQLRQAHHHNRSTDNALGIGRRGVHAGHVARPLRDAVGAVHLGGEAGLDALGLYCRYVPGMKLDALYDGAKPALCRILPTPTSYQAQGASANGGETFSTIPLPPFLRPTQDRL
ncbi:MAG: hypothetical protein Q7K03_01425, partial [Dehalococcoidia bacterium]|nr:hypothetical protein [Dehalococcoidia bacterium]